MGAEQQRLGSFEENVSDTIKDFSQTGSNRMFPSKDFFLFFCDDWTTATPDLDSIFPSLFSLPVYEVTKLVAAPTVKLG